METQRAEYARDAIIKSGGRLLRDFKPTSRNTGYKRAAQHASIELWLVPGDPHPRVMVLLAQDGEGWDLFESVAPHTIDAAETLAAAGLKLPNY